MKQPCGCCSGIEVVTPAAEANRPGLPALAYRAGTHQGFLESMIARLTSFYIDVPANDGSGNLLRLHPLRGLTTREPDDPSIALLDAWATVADVLTFYQERIANEGYLRTAVERRSVLELSRLIGYRLRPAVSASVYLAFTVADAFQGDIPLGTRAQSIPGPGEKPQFFETSEKLPARDTWNNLQPRLTRPQTITLHTSPGTDADKRDTVYLQGIASNLNPGDALLFVLGNGQGRQVLRKVHSVDAQTAQNRTEVILEEDPLQVTSGSTVQAARTALLPYAEEAVTIFSGNDLAEEVAGALKTLLDNISQAGSGQDASEMAQSFAAEIENWQSIAARRKFTRVKPWLADLKETVNALIPALLKTQPESFTMEGGEGPIEVAVAGGIKLLQSGLSASPLENLANIMGHLAKPASIQPANQWQLQRNIAQAFAPQADAAPRLLSILRPAAQNIYAAWARVETPSSRVQVYAMRVKAQLFGNNAPFRVTVKDGVPTFHEWMVYDDKNIDHEQQNVIDLDAAYDKVRPGSWLVIDTTGVAKTKIIASPGLLFAKAGSARTLSRADYGMSGKTTRLALVKPNDPASSVNWLDSSKADRTLDSSPDFAAIRSTIVYAQAEELELAEEPLDADVEGNKIELARLYDGLEAGRWIIVSGERTDIPNTSGVMANELVMISGVTQGSRPLFCAEFPGGFTPLSQYAYTTDANQYGDRLVVGYIDPEDLKKVRALFGTQRMGNFNAQFCDQVQLAPGLYASVYVPTEDEVFGKFPDFTGLLADPATRVPYPNGIIPTGTAAGEAGLPVFAWRISSQEVHTILTLANDLAYKYDPASVTIYGNVVKATHGQTTGEVLGNGDASQALQKFALHQSPLTMLSAATPSGAESTLVVRVNEVQWHEADNLAFLGPNDRKFITQTDDDDQTTAIFGNGEHGARVPSGTANVKAVYRYGCGKAGNVAAKQISQLSSQPLGVKSVINPLRASGGADHDTRDQARRNAPLAVMALDRLVSVRDYADFSRTYAGIGKAAAARLSDGHTLLVHVTIAGKDDVPIDQNSDLYRNLFQALEQYGDPYQPLRVGVRRLKLLVIHAGVKVLPDYQWESVGPAVKDALLDFYNFERRDLGQSAFMSEACAVMQAVRGVQYVDLRVFDSVGENTTSAQLANLAATLQAREFVTAEPATPDKSATDPALSILPAELVMLTPDVPDTLILTEITV
jgi:Baseplate J-like protein